MASDKARRAAVAYLRANATHKRHDDEIIFAKLLAGEMDELPIIQAFAAFEQQIYPITAMETDNDI